MKFEWRGEDVVLKDFDPREALKLALYIEQEGERFYAELMSRTKEKKIRNELNYLREEEAGHGTNFQKLLESWGRGATVDLKEDKLEFLAEKGVFGPIRRIRAEDLLCDNAEALRLGATVKKRMIAFFNALLENAENAAVRDTLERIIKEEKKHLSTLKLLMAY